MSSRSRAAGFVALSIAIAGCSLRSHPETASSASRKLSETERIAHVLSRLTYGARPGDAERVAAMGVNRWIDRQLDPASIPDSGVVVTLRSIPAWSERTESLALVTALPRALVATPMAALRGDSAARAALKLATARIISVAALTDQFYAGKIVRAQTSERQLLEIVSDFWANHFSVYNGKMPARETLIVWDRDVLRPHAFGKFRDLLGAVAHSPAMLFYLDNHLSTRRGLNENYARELLELHTLGVDGGYTQQDVIEVARALTGWSFNRSPTPTFVFRRDQHDTEAKTVLGHTLASGRGIEDGEEVLDMLARHPSTARYIAFKLARRLVSDEPPDALVERAAATFKRTDGDIAQVVRTIVTSPEFFSRAAFRSKVKTPFELVVSARRALGAPADTTPATARLIAQLGQPTYGWATPDGWPEKGGAWMNSGTIYKRIRFAGDIANGRVPTAPLVRWVNWGKLSTLAPDLQVDGVVADILAGCAEPATREAMLGSDAATNSVDGRIRLRELLAIALATPEFQRR